MPETSPGHRLVNLLWFVIILGLLAAGGYGLYYWNRTTDEARSKAFRESLSGPSDDPTGLKSALKKLGSVADPIVESKYVKAGIIYLEIYNPGETGTAYIAIRTIHDNDKRLPEANRTSVHLDKGERRTVQLQIEGVTSISDVKEISVTRRPAAGRSES